MGRAHRRDHSGCGAACRPIKQNRAEWSGSTTSTVVALWSGCRKRTGNAFIRWLVQQSRCIGHTPAWGALSDHLLTTLEGLEVHPIQKGGRGKRGVANGKGNWPQNRRRETAP